MNQSVGIVILNYNAYQETIKCVTSIRTRIKKLYQIVIVDNGSDNHSYEYLKKYYQNQEGTDVIGTGSNLGFARGNNAGIRYLRNKYHLEFILLLNSDTLIADERYIDRMLGRYRKGTGVIVSNVRNGRGNFIQPAMRGTTPGESLCTLLGAFCRYYDIYFPFRRRAGGRQYLCQIGCAILLTPDYLDIYRGLYSHTFLYGEEVILLILLDRAGLVPGFAEDTYILHNEGRSTACSMLSGSRKKDRKDLKGYWNIFLASCLPYRILVRSAGR